MDLRMVSPPCVGLFYQLPPSSWGDKSHCVKKQQYSYYFNKLYQKHYFFQYTCRELLIQDADSILQLLIGTLIQISNVEKKINQCKINYYILQRENHNHKYLCHSHLQFQLYKNRKFIIIVLKHYVTTSFFGNCFNLPCTDSMYSCVSFSRF